MYRHVCSFSFTKDGKRLEHTDINCRNKQKTKKRVCLGVGLPSACQFASRYVWSKTENSKHIKDELMANEDTAFSWFHSFKTFHNRHDSRTTPRFSLHIQNLKVFLIH